MGAIWRSLSVLPTALAALGLVLGWGLFVRLANTSVSDTPTAAGLAAPAVATAAPRCANATLAPASGNLPAIQRATLCLLNRERAKHGLRKLRANRALRGVAQELAINLNADALLAGELVAYSVEWFEDNQ